MLVDAERRTAEGERERLIGGLTTEPQTIEDLAKKAGVALTRAYRHMKVIRGTSQAQVFGQGVKGDPYLYSSTPTIALSSSSIPLEAEVKGNGVDGGLAA
jgi:hypothetical protein